MAQKTAHSNAWMAKGGIIGFAGAAISAVAGFALTVVMARMMGATGSGYVLQAIGIFSVVLALAKFGLDSTAIFMIPRVREDNPERVTQVYGYLLILAFTASLIIGSAVWLVAPHLWKAHPDVTESVRALMFFLPPAAMLLVSAGTMRALGGMSGYVLTQNIALPLGRLGIVAQAIALGASITWVAVAWALPLVLVLAISLAITHWQVRRILHTRARYSLPERQWRHKIHTFALPRTLSAALEQALIWADVVLVGYILGPAAAGIYGGASRFIQAGMIVDTALRVVVSPRLSTLVHRGDIDQVRHIHTVATQWLVVFAAPIYALMAVYAPTVMSILGPEYADGATTLRILCIAVALTFCAGNIHTLLIMSGYSGWAAINKVIVLFVNIVGNIIFLPIGGIEAAALVWSAAMMLDAGLATFHVRRKLGVTLSARSLVHALSVVIGAAVIPALIWERLFSQGIWQMITGTFMAMLVWGVTCYLSRGQLGLDALRQRNIKKQKM